MWAVALACVGTCTAQFSEVVQMGREGAGTVAEDSGRSWRVATVADEVERAKANLRADLPGFLLLALPVGVAAVLLQGRMACNPELRFSAGLAATFGSFICGVLLFVYSSGHALPWAVGVFAEAAAGWTLWHLAGARYRVLELVAAAMLGGGVPWLLTQAAR